MPIKIPESAILNTGAKKVKSSLFPSKKESQFGKSTVKNGKDNISTTFP